MASLLSSVAGREPTNVQGYFDYWIVLVKLVSRTTSTSPEDTIRQTDVSDSFHDQ
jgi:hypothetical protein